MEGFGHQLIRRQMLEQGFANQARGFKLPIFSGLSPVLFTARSRTSFFRYALFSQLAAPLTYLMNPNAQRLCPYPMAA